VLPKLVGRVVLLAFPKRFRDRVGQPLVQTLLDDCRTPRGRLAVGQFATGALDVVRAGFAERLSIRSRRVGGRRRSLVDAGWQDIRYAARRLAQSGGFTAVALLTLTLGIGANATLFQLLDAVHFRRLPVPVAKELAEIRISNFGPARGDHSWHGGATNPIFQQIRARQEAFSSVFAWSLTGMRLATDTGEPRFVSAVLVSGEFFPTLGVVPAVGRLLTSADDTPGCTTPGLVLNHAFWMKEFGGDPGAVGQSVTLGRDRYQIVGVAEPRFAGLDVGRRFDVAVPLCAEWLPPGSFNRLESGSHWFLVVMGRLKPGWTLDQARSQLVSISPAVFEASLPADYPPEAMESYRTFQLTALDASNGISLLREQYAASLFFLQATAGLVLLVGCANLANLMLARATTREREIATRIALGASRGQLVRVLLAESVLLSIAGAAAGAWLASHLSGFLVRVLDGGSQSLTLQMPLDWRLFAFMATAASVTCTLFGLVPAWRAANLSPELVLRGTGRGLSESRSRARLRRLLVVVQVGLSLVLLTGALLFARSLSHLALQDLGMQPDGLTITYLDMSRAGVPIERRAAFRRELMQRLAQTPGVVSAAETSLMPLTGSSSQNEVWLESAATSRGPSWFMETSAEYFETVGMPLIAGRVFDEERETAGTPLVAVVNEAFARRFLPPGDPIGRHFWREANPGEPEKRYEIVGLVKDAKYRTLRQEFEPVIYLAASQNPRPATFAQLLVRTSVPEASVIPRLRETFKAASPEIVATFQNFKEMIDRSLVQDQLLAGLSSFFAILAVLLSTLGLYGTMSFAVARRRQEIGLRMALGADRRAVLTMVLREACVLVAAGCLAGGALTLLLARSISALVYGVEPHDPASLIAAFVILAIVALAASVFPASQAARLNPMAAFRVE
jgi:putative ABC transport system permease protein